MDYKQLLTAITTYYGKYSSELSEKVVYKYIKSRFKESDLENIFARLTLKYSNRYKTPPDPAVFEEVFGDSETKLEAEAIKHWNGINNKVNCYADIIFEDIRLQRCIEGMGGWVAFCNRSNDPGSEVWAQKRFIELYKMYSTINDESEKPRLLSGMVRRSALIIRYGDKVVCDKLLGENILPNKIEYDIDDVVNKSLKIVN